MILTLPDTRLRLVSMPVREEEDCGGLVAAMLKAMLEAQGIGLAAIQVGIPKRLIVLGFEPWILINPKIVRKSTTLVTMREGCLSIPGFYADVLRPEKIGVQYIAEDGQERFLAAKATLSRVIQHEIDHLDGILFTDHLLPGGHS